MLPENLIKFNKDTGEYKKKYSKISFFSTKKISLKLCPLKRVEILKRMGSSKQIFHLSSLNFTKTIFIFGIFKQLPKRPAHQLILQNYTPPYSSS
jgi:hypothetical protein